MAEGAVLSALENLKQLLLNHADRIQDVASHVESLDSDLRLFRAFLKEPHWQSSKKTSSLDSMKEIRLKIYEVEDAIETSIIEAAAKKPGSRSSLKWSIGSPKRGSRSFLKWSRGSPKPKDFSVAERVDSIRGMVRSIMDTEKKDSVMDTTAEAGMADRIQGIKVREDNIEGFEDEVKKVISLLYADTDKLDVVSITGMPGLGKTALAGMVYQHPQIQSDFSPRAWVTVSQIFNKREVFLAILKEFNCDVNKLTSLPDQEIAQMLRKHLQESGRFLIVLDDIWGIEAWMNLRDAFPKLNREGKILITSRTQEAGVFANPNTPPYTPPFLTPDESWDLLQFKVSHGAVSPPNLQEYKHHIVQKCGGLPLAIVAIGEILRKESSTGDTMAIMDINNVWKKAAESVADVIASSYNNLPYYLRPCFLYLGVFPEDFEIPVQTFIRLWVLEGYIQETTGITLEQTAEAYLNELVNHNLVTVGSLRADGRIKTCRVHSLLRHFCKIESEKENSFQEFTKCAQGDFIPPIATLQTCLSICIQPRDIPDFLSARPSGQQVRSFLCFSKEEEPLENDSAIAEAFKLLRVFYAKPIIFAKFPGNLTKLVHLRFIVLSGNIEIIPETIEELRNLRSLNVYTSSDILEIKANIWGMFQLRHVKTKASAVLPEKGKKTEQSGEKLRTLETISTQSCTEDMFDILQSLRKLGIRGQLVSLLDMLDTKGLDKLENLVTLKLFNVKSSSSSTGDGLPRLPVHNRFPPQLRSLTLYATYLDWVHMSTLGMLINLKVLKLKENAFTGDRWETSTGGFLCLELLHIENTNLRVWVAEASNFPSLKGLVLRNCEDLEKIPYELSDVQSFQTLDLKFVKESAVASAREIEAKKKQQEQDLHTFKRFILKLDIALSEE